VQMFEFYQNLPTMSALGQKQTRSREITMSALTPKADIDARLPNLRFVPIGMNKHAWSKNPPPK
jgi:hypothetical protein